MIKLDDNDLNEILITTRIFFLEEEAPELLDQIAANYRSNTDLNAVKRNLHSLKGAAATGGLPTLETLAHKLESVLEALNLPDSDRELLSQLFQSGIQQFKDLVEEGLETIYRDEADFKLTELAICTAIDAALLPQEPSVLIIDRSELQSILEVDLEQKLQELESLAPNDLNLKMSLLRLTEDCRLLGDTLGLDWLNQIEATSQSLLKTSSKNIDSIATETIGAIRSGRDTYLGSNNNVSTTDQVDPPPLPIEQSLHLSIAVPQLERLTNCNGELYIIYQQLFDLASNVSSVCLNLKRQTKQFKTLLHPFKELENWGAAKELTELTIRFQETRSDLELTEQKLQEQLALFRQLFEEMQREFVAARLISFSTISERFLPMIDSLNQTPHKSVQLNIIGGEVLVDRTILEQLKNPILHLIRNAFDHGIEEINIRQQHGKPLTGRLDLSARISGNNLIISLSDDGRGIDLKKVRSQAEKQGYCSKSDCLTPAKIIDFLFAPKFSTTESITPLSGRGIGLDTVKLQVERCGGKIDVDTAWKRGTTFTLTVPLKFQVVPLTICKGNGCQVGIPSNHLIEVVELDPTSTAKLDWQTESLPLFNLNTILASQRQTELTAAKLGLILTTNLGTVAIAVETIVEEAEFLIKPFNQAIAAPTHLSGCTILGTKEIVPILNPEQLSYFGLNSTPPKQLSATTNNTILIVDDSVSARRYLANVLTSAGYQVIETENGEDAIETLLNLPECALIISDLEMPTIDGFRLLDTVRNIPQWQTLPTIMLTSRDTAEYRDHAKNLGANAYFSKPFVPQQLLETVAQLILPCQTTQKKTDFHPH